MAPMKITQQEIRSTLEKSHDDYPVLAGLLSTLATQFGSDTGHELSPQIKKVASVLVRAAQSKEECESAAKLIFNLLSKSIQDRTVGVKSRKAIVFYVANLMLKLYFRLQIAGPGQFDSISRNVISSGVRFSQYPRSDRVGYRYHLGRYYLSQQQYRRARSHLQWAFDNCSNEAYHNKRLILLYLTTASLPIGIFMVPDLLQAFQLAAPFVPLMAALQKGDYQKYHNHLDANEEWFSAYAVYLCLDQRCDVILFRSLFRRAFMLSDTSGQRTPNIKLSRLLQALQWATMDHSWTLNECEAICISMIDTGYIKGYIHHTNQVLVLDKRDEKKFGFPDVSVVHVVQFDNDDEDQFSD